MRAAYYPWCSLHSTAVEYDQSTRASLEALGVTLEELNDWNCCGATPAHASDEYLAVALPLRNLAQVESMGHTDLVVPCAACYSAMRTAQAEIREGHRVAVDAAQDVERITSKKLSESTQVLHPIEVMNRPEILDRLSRMAGDTLKGVRVASYYGCLLVRPRGVVCFDDPEMPHTMDRLVEAVGGEPVNWSYKVDCCGATLALARSEVVGRLVSRIVDGAREAGADLIITACPLCQSNLETRQTGDFPVFYFSELVGMALGLEGHRKWLNKHFVKFPDHILAQNRGDTNI